MKKKLFFGRYFKFVAKDQFAFAIIDSVSREGRKMQLITPDGSYEIEHPETVHLDNNILSVQIKQDDLTMSGIIQMSHMHPLKKHTMGPFRHFQMQCTHKIISMYHRLSGTITVNGVPHDMSHGYIEGDEGISFPDRYIWFNSSTQAYGVTAAIATIPFGPFHFTGILCFVVMGNKEYYLCTYNGAKAFRIRKNHIVISKGHYELEVLIDATPGHPLRAPVSGQLKRYIKENIAVAGHVIFRKDERILLDSRDPNASFEYMWD